MFSLLFPFFGKFAAGNIKALVKKTKMQVVCSAFIGAALFFAVLFICLMLFFYLWSFMSPVKAAAILALVWLLIAFIGLICMKISLERQKKAQQAQADNEQKKLLASTAIAAVPGLLAIGAKSYKRMGLLAVLATGAVAAYGLLHGKIHGADSGNAPEA